MGRRSMEEVRAEYEAGYLHRDNKMYEGGRIMLPEHLQGLRDLKERQKQDPKPDLSEEDFTDLGYAVTDAVALEALVTVKYWEDGYYSDREGIIYNVDMQLRQLKLNDDWLKIDQIKTVELK